MPEVCPPEAGCLKLRYVRKDKMKLFDYAERLKQLPPYLFKEIDRKKAEVMARGVDIIDLGVGDPDLPTPQHIIGEMKKAVDDPANHRYPSYSGMDDFKEAVAGW